MINDFPASQRALRELRRRMTTPAAAIALRARLRQAVLADVNAQILNPSTSFHYFFRNPDLKLKTI